MARTTSDFTVVPTPGEQVLYALVGPGGEPVASVRDYLAELLAADCSPLTLRSYAFDLLDWFRFLLCTCQASGCESVGSCWLSVTAFAAGPGAPQEPVGGPRRPLLASRRPCERTRRWYP
jgi:hypothetical protein